MTNTSLEVIGYVRCDYKEKFGIPRQSGLTGRAAAFIEILPPYNQAEAFRGLDGFSHIWLLWDFSRAHKNGFTATVKPPDGGFCHQIAIQTEQHRTIIGEASGHYI